LIQMREGGVGFQDRQLGGPLRRQEHGWGRWQSRVGQSHDRTDGANIRRIWLVMGM
jgi:hypothetical protein